METRIVIGQSVLQARRPSTPPHADTEREEKRREEKKKTMKEKTIAARRRRRGGGRIIFHIALCSSIHAEREKKKKKKKKEEEERRRKKERGWREKGNEGKNEMRMDSSALCTMCISNPSASHFKGTPHHDEWLNCTTVPSLDLPDVNRCTPVQIQVRVRFSSPFFLLLEDLHSS
jgi:hypothetical protein